MKENMISYYDLLTMIKNKKYPKIYWHTGFKEKVLYVPIFDCFSNEFVGYNISNSSLEDENTRFYLSECMLESSMFDECLEIKENDIQKEISKLQSEIDLLSNEIRSYHNKIHSMRDRNNYMKEQLKDLMKEVKR